MRIPNPRVVRLAGITKGAIIEPADAEYEIPAVLTDIVELPSPINAVLGIGTAAPNPLRDSIYKQDEISIAGAAAGSFVTLIIFEAGLWTLDIAFDGMFTGTTNLANTSSLQLVDPSASGAPTFALRHITGNQSHHVHRMSIAFQRNNFELRLVQAATAIGDNLSISAAIYANRRA